ncbi:hypothetical protein BV210_04260 [Halorientalis sp. IM1011]|uniref:hypothetical protein n=1 Tax=Halorientalis sp. IM1011 TaxID=1932360 RepID=UPI00097CD325|nr:hypothetical protein [Halorientalis sp. IM1011]AQL41978.1 hypothetical protein BV210_04260 [Halorientalis sp. IM1011]
MALPVPGLPELFVALAVLLFYAVFLLGLVALGVRIALGFMDHPESEEIQKRVALLERKVERLEAQVEAGEDTADDGD